MDVALLYLSALWTSGLLKNSMTLLVLTPLILQG